MLTAMLVLAQFVPEPRSALGFRVRVYPVHALWFLGVLCLVTAVVGAWNAPRGMLAVALLSLGAVVMATNLADALLLADPAKLLFGALAGAAFVRVVERPWWLVPICLLVPAADAWSVFSERGITNEVVERAAEEPAWIQWPTIATPIAGLDYDQFGRLGIVDILFAGLFLGAAVRWRWPLARGVLVLAGSLVLTSVLVFERSGLAVPALPLLCIGCLVAYAPQLARDTRAAWQERGRDAP